MPECMIDKLFTDTDSYARLTARIDLEDVINLFIFILVLAARRKMRRTELTDEQS